MNEDRITFNFISQNVFKSSLALSTPSSMPMLQIRWTSVCNVLHGYEQLFSLRALIAQ